MNSVLDKQLQMAVTTSVADITRLNEIVTIEEITR